MITASSDLRRLTETANFVKQFFFDEEGVPILYAKKFLETDGHKLLS